MKKILAIIGGTLLTIVILGAVVVAGWEYREYSVNRTADIRRDGFEFQQSLRDELVDQADDLATVDAQIADPDTTVTQAQALKAQRSAMADQLCSIAADLTGDVSVVHMRIIEKEC